MTTDTADQAKNLVAFLEAHRDIIQEAQSAYRNATTNDEKVAALNNLLTKKAQLQASLPPRESKCLFSIGPGTATIVTTVVVSA
jgi:hypothetical protein